uniref:AB hydrolase-1 domain-containing protein n=1 Tax=Rhabditophanes sp. KR3021 TaxID=114890 RepID=A0AC35UHK7_9BILA
MIENNNLREIQIEFETPNGLIEANVIIQDTLPLGSCEGTAVFIHGAPGSYKDFKYIVPFLKKKRIRCVCINFCGFGVSDNNEQFTHTNQERVLLVKAVLQKIKVHDKIIFVGHSRGTENALKLVTVYAKNSIGVVLINPLPVKLYKALKESYWIFTIFGYFWKARGVFSYFYLRLALYLYNWSYSKHELDPYIIGNLFQCMGTVDLKDQIPYVEKFNSQYSKLLIAYGGNDPIIDIEATKDFVDRFTLDSELTFNGDDEDNMSGIKKEFQKGSNKISCYFEKGNHFLQKHQAQFLAEGMLTMFNNCDLIQSSKL